MRKFIGVLNEVVAALESYDDNFIGVDEEIDTLSSGSHNDKTSTSPAESPIATDDDTWRNSDEAGEIVATAGSGTIASGTILALTDMQAAITKGCGHLKADRMSSAFATAQLVEFQSQLESLAPRERT